MGILDELLQAALQSRAKADSYGVDRRRWDSASVFNSITGSGGTQDKGAAARPNPFVLPLSWGEIEALWENNGIARKIVELIPDRSTRKGWDITFEGGALDEEEGKRLRIVGNLYEGLLWGRLYGGALVLMVTEDDVPAMYQDRPKEWLRKPLDLQRIGKLHALQVFDVYDCSPQDWDTDPEGNNYRMPETWSINADGLSATVHHSRVLHFRGARRPPSWRRHGFRTYHNFPDISVLQSVWDDIRRYTDTMQGGATVAQELRQHVLKLGDFKASMHSSQIDTIRTRLAAMTASLSTNGMAIIGPDDEYHQAQSPPSGFLELSDAAREALSAVTSIPQVILFGDTPSGLNTDGDSAWEGFRQMISSVQEDKLKPNLEKLAQVVFAAQDGPTRGQIPAGFKVKFRALAAPSDMEQAALRAQVADTDSSLVQLGVLTPATIARHRYGKDGWRADPPQLSDEELADVAFDAEYQRQLEMMPPEEPEPGAAPQEAPANGAGPPQLPPAS